VKSSHRILAAAIALAASLALPASAREKIESFHSLIEIAPDGTLRVQEKIAVVAEGKQIQRGIYRDFPTTYVGRWGTKVVVPFDVVGIRRDGQTEPFHVEPIQDGVRVYIGKRDRKLAPGPHVYELTYTTHRQLGFFEEHDELYWNVTGNFWAFPIQAASAVIRLPDGATSERIAHTGFTGPIGSKARDLRSWVDASSTDVHFETTAPLPAGHGLTVVALFPKGLVSPPSDAELQQALFDANKALFLGGIGAVFVLAYYLLAWLLVGRDPAAGTIIPRFEPPQTMSPACMRHLMRMGYDAECFATALVSMAVKGFLRIDEKGGQYTLVRLSDDRSNLSPGERRIADKLLETREFALRRRHHAKIREAIERFKEWLDLEHEGELFKANRWWLVPGVAISIVAVVIAGISGASENLPGMAFVLVWLSIWTLAVVTMLRQVVQLWRAAIRSGPGFPRFQRWVGALFMTAVCLPFLGGEGLGLYLLTQATSLWMVPILLGIIGMNALFYTLLKQPTVAGRRTLDEIEGFKLYLQTAEGDDIARLQAPAETPELFERYLPYALALGVENVWSERFSDVLRRASEGGDRDYAPTWYRGSDFRLGGIESFTASLGPSLAGAVSSTSTAPGSSSGGGGGSSGGGGGGGGGGGW
jgi:uncharacterized membrane protein YgcG